MLLPGQQHSTVILEGPSVSAGPVGCVTDPAGLDVERLLALRERHGYECVARYGLPVQAPSQLVTAADADAVVPATRPGTISRRIAESLPASVRVVAPAANAPYTSGGADVLQMRGILALPDFVCHAGAVIGYRPAADATPEQVLAKVEETVAALIAEAVRHPRGPLAGACERAAGFLRGWWGDAPAPPFAGAS
jgi:glutamate dehydrogenase (NAD(P)+)